MTDTKPTPNYDARQLATADMRLRFKEAVVDPLRETLRNRSGLQAATAIIQIPVEAATSGFTVTMAQHKDGWHLEMSRRIDPETTFDAFGRAKSLKAALVQLVEGGLMQLDQLDSDTRAGIQKLADANQATDVKEEVAA